MQTKRREKNMRENSDKQIYNSKEKPLESLIDSPLVHYSDSSSSKSILGVLAFLGLIEGAFFLITGSSKDVMLSPGKGIINNSILAGIIFIAIGVICAIFWFAKRR
jgi:hypothetical protein